MITSDLALTLALVILAAVLVAFIIGYNGLVRARNRVREGWSSIDVQLRRRASLVPNLVEAVRGYAAHERGVFDEVSQARSALQQARRAGEAAGANNVLSQALGHLMAVAEAYPQLRASETFAGLQQQLTDVEDKIAFARQFYNRTALDYNNRIESFPGLLIAGPLGFSAAEFFETPADTRADVAVDLSPERSRAGPAPQAPPT
jgi:LemA protein